MAFRGGALSSGRRLAPDEQLPAIPHPSPAATAVQQTAALNANNSNGNEQLMVVERVEAVKTRQDEMARLHAEVERLRSVVETKDAQMERLLAKKDELYLGLLEKKDEQLMKKDEHLMKKDEQLMKKDEQLERLLTAQARPSFYQQQPVSQGTLPSEMLVPPTAPSRNLARQVDAVPNQQLHHVDPAQLVVQLQAGGGDAEAALTSVFEHALEILEALISSIPRKQRKPVKAQCERLEAVLDSINSDISERLATCDVSELRRLSQRLCALKELQTGGESSVATVAISSALSELKRCSDAVTGARRQLGSTAVDVRRRGLETLRRLPRVVLETSVETEVEAAVVACDMAMDDQQYDADELGLAWMALFTLGLRNTDAAGESIKKGVMGCPGTWRDALPGVVQAGSASVCQLCQELSFKSKTSALRGSWGKALLALFGPLMKVVVTAERYTELLPQHIELMKHEDLALACNAAFCTLPLVTSTATCLPIALSSPTLIPALLEVQQRAQGAKEMRRPASWWKARAETVNLDSICVSAAWTYITFLVNNSPQLSAGTVEWQELLAEAIHILKINEVAQLSAQDRMPFGAIDATAAVVAAVALKDPARHKALLASGVVQALLWTTAHGVMGPLGGNFASKTATASVALIGRNEGGLILTREVIDLVLDEFHLYFDQISTHWLAKRGAKAPAKKVTIKCKPIVDIVISDQNKSSVLGHAHALDDLVLGLLVDDGNARRGTEGDDELQETCALVLQNLALSDIGKVPLRAHADVMRSLRKVATVEGGLTETARRYASGALFELDEVARQKAKAAKLAAKDASSSGNNGDDHDAATGADCEHVMLSYNWKHQVTIKRLNLALKARSYSVWIDIEKMQGSTVDAMSEAVENCAVMCYAVAKEYKESTNCRMEAQYAHQQQKDMVPLMMEEGYNAKGWLGMMLGVRLWYGFFGTVLETADAFEAKVEELCRELGTRGQVV